VVDDLGWRDISYHDAEYQTPVIDSLFADGIELSNYYVHPSCSPTRASLLTGKYAWKTG
jgi:arylsulfatase A-like enzyme